MGTEGKVIDQTPETASSRYLIVSLSPAACPNQRAVHPPSTNNDVPVT